MKPAGKGGSEWRKLGQLSSSQPYLCPLTWTPVFASNSIIVGWSTITWHVIVESVILVTRAEDLQLGCPLNPSITRVTGDPTRRFSNIFKLLVLSVLVGCYLLLRYFSQSLELALQRRIIRRWFLSKRARSWNLITSHQVGGSDA